MTHLSIRFSFYLRFSLLLTVLCPQGLFSETGKVDLRFIAFPKATISESIELRVGENETIDIRLPYRSPSQGYKVPAMANWTLGKTTRADGEDPVFQSFGSSPSTGTKQQLVIVLRKGKTNAEGLEMIVVDYSDSGFGGGDYFMINSSRVPIAGLIGEVKFVLQPRQNKILAPEPSKTKDGHDYCHVKVYYRSKNEVQPFFSSTWRFNEEARSMVFFFHDPNTGQLRLHTTRSFVSDEG